ncbi:hypothetical protein BKA65DRAFT_479731 [Rhexocercosporidium sp. MPI-PUGE-AT-0058]|nr:hypothetical protein BKA65DRAFT_479731 [Rhexocercosporidium sp. MPI-PUGE-AT-0058]
MTFVEPLRNNKNYQELRGNLPAAGEKRKVRWPAEPVKYLWKLVEIGTLQKNPELNYSDFKYVTEAYHRRYAGTMIDGKIFVERGWHNVHSKIEKDPNYKVFLKRILG